MTTNLPMDSQRQQYHDIAVQLADYATAHPRVHFGQTNVKAGRTNLTPLATSLRKHYWADRLHSETVDMLEAIASWSWREQVAIWEAEADKLRVYVMVAGTAVLPVGIDQNVTCPLVKVADNARRSYADGAISMAGVAAFEALPGWTWDAFDSLDEAVIRGLDILAVDDDGALLGDAITEDFYGMVPAIEQLHRDRDRLRPDQVARLQAHRFWDWNLAGVQARILGHLLDENVHRIDEEAARQGWEYVPSQEIFSDGWSDAAHTLDNHYRRGTFLGGLLAQYRRRADFDAALAASDARRAAWV